MTSFFLCLLALSISFITTRRSLVAGLATVLGIGYFYGIIRANVPETFSHLIFDAGVLGLYFAQLTRRVSPEERIRTQRLWHWVAVLIAWPVLLFLIPIQDPLIQLVGLRGNAFLVPFLLIGARLDHKSIYILAWWLAGLNLMAFIFAGAEFFLGVPQFFPYRAGVTDIIYKSNDLMGFTAFRIPATFTSAHAYAGTMVMTIPFLVGAWIQKGGRRWHGYLLAAALAVSILGIFMSAARIHFIVLLIMLVVTTFSGQLKRLSWTGWLVMLVGIGWIVFSDERLQRFTTLQDTEFVTARFADSVSLSFWELVGAYPLGNGMGGGGTSIPYFLQDLIKTPIAFESEYARIALEQGLPGLFLWVAFILWVLTRRTFHRLDTWYLGQRLAWFACAAYFATGLIGIGLFTSVPHTCLLLLTTGWIAVRQPFGTDSPPAALGRQHREGKIGARHFGR